MVKTENGIKYTVHLVTTQFGNLVAKVCEYLLRKGSLTLPNIVRYTELSQTQVKNSLLVLIQHNCVQAFRLEESGGGFQATPKQTIQYVALFDNILHRLRFPKFLTIITQEFESDKLCVQIVEGLLQHGRLSLKQIVDRANSNHKEGKYLVKCFHVLYYVSGVFA
ncbi:uncharacterized protein [Euphorbia lathyris]|uniref:uncharacterized protein n=1 Tax=Euphorbia lathyris TaxID=212925 RepID=UPI0033142248